MESSTKSSITKRSTKRSSTKRQREVVQRVVHRVVPTSINMHDQQKDLTCQIHQRQFAHGSDCKGTGNREKSKGIERNRKKSKGDRGRSVYETVSRSTTNVKRTVRGEVGHFEHDPHDQMRTGRFTVHQCTGRLTSGGTVFNGRHQIIRVFAQTFNGSFHPYLHQPHQ